MQLRYRFNAALDRLPLIGTGNGFTRSLIDNAVAIENNKFHIIFLPERAMKYRQLREINLAAERVVLSDYYAVLRRRPLP